MKKGILLMALIAALFIGAALTACGTIGSVGAGVSLGNGLCFNVEVKWDDKTVTVEEVKTGDLIDQLKNLELLKGKKIVDKPVVVALACDRDGNDTGYGNYYVPDDTGEHSIVPASTGIINALNRHYDDFYATAGGRYSGSAPYHAATRNGVAR